MKPFLRRPSFVMLLALASATGAVACGASINAVYESDVRFEHCMALEEREETKSTTQRSCWDEWVKYYTFGQTRDRVDYARRRQKQLSGESDFEETFTAPAIAQRVVPEPTSVLAPPPMMIADAGSTADATPDAAATSEPVVEPPGAACATACRDKWTACEEPCKTPGCKRACESKYRVCMDRCF